MDNILKAVYSKGEMSEIRQYYNRFVVLANDRKRDDIDAFKFCRVLNVEIVALQVAKPDHTHLIDEAVEQFKRTMKKIRAAAAKKRGWK